MVVQEALARKFTLEESQRVFAGRGLSAADGTRDESSVASEACFCRDVHPGQPGVHLRFP